MMLPEGRYSNIRRIKCLHELCAVMFLFHGIAAINGMVIIIRGVLVVFGVFLAWDTIPIGLSKDLLTTPLFPCVIVFDLVFGILLVFAGFVLVVNPVNDFIDYLRLFNAHLLHLLLFGNTFILLFLSLDVVLFLVLFCSALLASLIGLFKSSYLKLTLSPLSNNKTCLLLLDKPSGSFLLLTKVLPLLVDLFVKIWAQFVIDQLIGENPLDKCFEDINEVYLAFGMIMDLNFKVSQQLESMDLFDDEALVVVDQVPVLLADASVLSSTTILNCIWIKHYFWFLTQRGW